MRWLLRVLDETDGVIDMEKMKPDVKQAILWTREAWKNFVTEKTIVNCWRKVGILPGETVDTPEPEDTISVMRELAVLLADFSSYEVPDLMSVEELVAVDAALPTEGEVEEAEEEESSDDDSIELKLLTLKEARESVQANQESRDLGPFADMMNALTIQLDRTVVTVRHHQAPATQFFPVLSRDT